MRSPKRIRIVQDCIAILRDGGWTAGAAVVLIGNKRM